MTSLRRALTALALTVLVATTAACTGDSDTPAGREGDPPTPTVEPTP